MKRSTFFLAIFLSSFAYSTHAQINASYSGTSDAEADALANLLGVQKKEAVAQLVHVTGKDSIAFWGIYNEYQNENKKVMKDRIGLYEHTAQAYGNLTPAIADSLANLYFVNRVSQEKSLQEYYSKIKAATNAVVAFQFYQSEVYLLTLVRAQIMQQIPTYGQLMNAAKK